MTVRNTAMLPVLHSPLLRATPGVAHGFFTRLGGVSVTPYDSLNCSFGSDDDAVAVEENRRRVADAMGFSPDRLFTLAQVHGRDVVNVDHDEPGRDRKGDALVSSTPGVLVGVNTADCVPVLMADPEARVVAAAHAGWRGALAGVVAAALDAMEAAGASRRNVRAAIGPSIQQSSYEVGEDVVEAVRDGAPFDPSYLFDARGDRFLFDLPGFVRGLCLEAGVTLLDDIGGDTCADPARFFSYRRTTRSGEADYGRQIAVIGVAGRETAR